MIIDVTAAIICKDETYLIARRSAGSHLAGLWEFPGGKLEEGENHAECLAREILEELELEITVGAHVFTSEYDYGEKEIRLHAYFAEVGGGNLELHSHAEIAWVTPAEFDNYEFAPADIPIIQRLK